MLIAANQKKGHSGAHTAVRQVWVRGEVRQLFTESLPPPHIFPLSFVESFRTAAAVRELEQGMTRLLQAGHTGSDLDTEKQVVRSL